MAGLCEGGNEPSVSLKATDVFLQSLEDKHIGKLAAKHNIISYNRYVDDTLLVFESHADTHEDQDTRLRPLTGGGRSIVGMDPVLLGHLGGMKLGRVGYWDSIGVAFGSAVGTALAFYARGCGHRNENRMWRISSALAYLALP
ncbi:hypothetical protein ANN_17534 [Periplaneta americana]|uniref:Uncharacterized protein n=1 Tax=Periplaneta americana TaxID=6978 RepID=A0ABQ8SUG9_PERAM|nr:hypothetical protein ANN_17534 [Periplaneta americana]